ncbi:halocyanin domain-containing protein [Halorubrum sp. JWXQ-INN 858]|uniref:halocyanin domain-containing protein n=1 Tax=Halorubrum sp. JWXQ-INN 858 TaxID=2690782 RepID=UPI00135935A4|nr:halocyanin domain-containing protein [Halorubrum sp. JWXQ-INN 858]MWV65019.1 halocyanin domain-containing protein [Halorubrum sp. JWXQ-INN 858]
MAEPTRREFVSSTGTLAVVALAGCADDDGADGDPEDLTGEDAVDVVVGAGNGLEFAPADVVVEPGTTVVWEWTGNGGGHDVVEVDGAFESDLVDEAGYTFEHTFDEPGLYEYVCTPHQTSGMTGTVDVVE